jgi:F-type H+-transporting ATPase subunit gamma
LANIRLIRRRIRSIQSTAKITRAMEMIAASKMRRAQEAGLAGRPYSEKIHQVIADLAALPQEGQPIHPLLQRRPVTKIAIVYITPDRGLCGGLNTNSFRLLIREIQEWQAKGVEVDLALLGSKGVQFFRSLNVNVVAAISNIGENPKVADLIGSIKVMLDAFETGGEEGGIDRLFLLHNVFENTMSQKPTAKTLIPVEAPDAGDLPKHWDYIYEPEATELLTSVLQRYIESQVYRGAVENVACEMAAKMVAMKSATENAGGMIDNLQLDYNKARQAAITQEISEIVGGAAAVSE